MDVAHTERARLHPMDRPKRFESTIEHAREGDRPALAELYRELHPPILRYLRALEPAEGEDLASEVWLDVIAHLDRFRGDRHALRSWTFTIARSRLIDLRRRRARRATDPADPEEIARHAQRHDVEEEAMASLSTEDALARIASLPPAQAEVVLLRILGDLSVRDVAAIMGKRPGTVRVLQHRALRRLAEQLSPKAVTT
jgi:RNA polymerase sigma-70 factor, ECF subfamily